MNQEKHSRESDAVERVMDLRFVAIKEMSPAGTAELSPGRSPGSAGAMEKSRRDDWKLPGHLKVFRNREFPDPLPEFSTMTG